ncbi:hypothetical protein ACNH6C_09900 [Bdellovibrio bacteriovorus]|uniref:hypothetical protein n=1 Tax=Bdellovibrio bacteriovorus TaxID=959 RepID=UPI003A7F8315
MTTNSSGLLVSNTKQMIQTILKSQEEFSLAETLELEDRTTWKVILDARYSLVMNLYLFRGYPFLNVSIGLAEVPQSKMTLVATKALALNEYMGLAGRYGMDGSILSLSFQLPLPAIDREYVHFVVQQARTLADDTLAEFKEHFDLAPLMVTLNKQSQLN